MQGPTLQSRTYFSGALAPTECVAGGGGWVVLPRWGLKLFIECADSGASQEVQAKVGHSLCSSQGYSA